MKVAAFNGSPKRDGNTARLLGYALAELEAAGVETESSRSEACPSGAASPAESASSDRIAAASTIRTR